MAQIFLKGNAINTNCELPKVGNQAPDFKLTKTDLSDISLADFKGKNILLNIFPSLDTGICATSIRTFNKEASELKDTVVICVSKDLPFAHARFCTTEGINNVVSASELRPDSNFAKDYGIQIIDGPMSGLMARAVVVIDAEGKIKYTQLVNEISTEPDYDKAIKAI